LNLRPLVWIGTLPTATERCGMPPDPPCWWGELLADGAESTRPMPGSSGCSWRVCGRWINSRCFRGVGSDWIPRLNCVVGAGFVSRRIGSADLRRW